MSVTHDRHLDVVVAAVGNDDDDGVLNDEQLIDNELTYILTD
jgi:hypothetical protein